MKSIQRTRRTRLAGLLATTVLGLFSATASANHVIAYDILGLSQPTDATDWVDPSKSLPRGGDSDVMSIFDPSGKVFAQAFAFGWEEDHNVYYFDPAVVGVNAQMFGKYTTLLEADAHWSDTFGVAWIPGVPGQTMGDVIWDGPIPIIPGFLALAFMSDEQDPARIPPPLDGLTFIEKAGMANPVPEPDSDDSQYLTIAYDATRYLAPELQLRGYTADFRSDIPEPASASLACLGIAGLLALRRRKPG